MAVAEKTALSPRWYGVPSGVILACLVPAVFYYALLLTVGTAGLLAPAEHGPIFNSMLLHLLQGRFDVDPASVGDEGYLRDGATYAYFGIFPALFRVLFLWLPDFAHADLTRVGCLAAVSAMALFKIATARLVWRQAGKEAPSVLLTMLTIAILLSGPQIQFLRPSVYQEVMLWSGALTAAFVYLVLRGLCDGAGFTPRLMNWMALVAGLTLLTRVSAALGPYLGLGVVWLYVAWTAFKSGKLREQLVGLAAPTAVLAGFVVLTGFINAERWGNPWTFVDLSRALILAQYPDRLARLHAYGEFNPIRIGFGLIYYFLPLWVLRDGNGHFWWGDFQERVYDNGIELPPSSFFVSDPLLIALAVCGAVTVGRYHDRERRVLVMSCALALFVPAGLLLTFPSLTFRYRMEFYPFFELFAFLGFQKLASRPTARTVNLVAIGAFAGVITAHAMWVIYFLSPLGLAIKVMGPLGIIDFYHSRLLIGS
jgi:hypothetical protein